MSWNELLMPIVGDYLVPLVAPLVIALFTAAGGWVLSVLPGPVRSFLTANVHEKDMNLFLGALARGADAAVKSGKFDLTAFPLQQVISYVKANVGDTVKKLAPSEEAMRVMASDAITAALVRVAQAQKAQLDTVPGTLPGVLSEGVVANNLFRS